MNSRGQFSIIAALLVAVILIATVITTYSAIRYSAIQDEPQVLSAIDEINLALKQVLGFTAGYYGSVLQVTGNSSYAKTLAQNYLTSGLENIGDSNPESGASFNVTALDLSTNWFTNASYSIGHLSVTYDLSGLGLYGISYNASCRLDVQVSKSASSSQACLSIFKDENEPLINLGKQNFKFYRYRYSNLTWEFSSPGSGLTAFTNGTYLIDIPSGIDSSMYVIQVEDTRGIIVAASSYNRYTASLSFNSTFGQGVDYVDTISNLYSPSDEGTHSNFTAQQYGPDSIYDTLTKGNVGTENHDYYPVSNTTIGSTTLVSGSINDLQSVNGNFMTFRSYASSTSVQTLYAHRETTSIRGTPYYNLLFSSADASGLTLSKPMSSSRVLIGQSVYSLQGVSSIPTSMWTMYYRAWRDAPTPSASTNNPSSTSGGWTNPTNAYADGGGYAYSTVGGSRQMYGGYGFSVPSGAQITQVRVRLDAYRSGGDGNDGILLEVSDGTGWLATTQEQSLTASEATYWVDVTGWTSWTQTKVNSIQTRISHVRYGSLTDEVRLDWIPIEVTYTVSTVDPNPPSSNSGTGGGWSNPSNAYADDSYYATSNANNEQVSYWGYGFALPADAVITQVRVRLDAWCSSTSTPDDIRLEASSDGGSSWLPTNTVQQLTGSQAQYWIDITSWTSWTYTKVNNIRTRVTHVQDGSLNDIYLDYIPVEVTYTTTSVTTGSPSSTSGGWTNPTNAYADGGYPGYASSTVGGSRQMYSGYGFSIPSGATITQVRVRLDAYCTSNDDILLEVSADGGSTWLATTQTQSVATYENTYWVDVTSWTSWTPANINSDNIKARVTHVVVSPTDEVRLDWIPIEVTYTTAITAHADVDMLIRRSDGSIRTTIATNVAASGDLSSTPSTLSGTYSWTTYSVVNQTDYLEIDYYVDVATTSSLNAYLMLDDITLDITNQTRIANVILPSEYTCKVEFEGLSNTYDLNNLLWSIACNASTTNVDFTFQLWNYTAGKYSTSGVGCMTNITGASITTYEQSITANPADFKDSAGRWKLNVTAVKSTSSQFDINLDMVRYRTGVAVYALDLEEQWTNVHYTGPPLTLCIYAGAMGSENLVVDAWHSGSWNNLNFTGLVSGWNNVSVVSLADSQTFTIRFRANNSTLQSNWQIDSVLLRSDANQSIFLSLQDSVTVEVLQNGTMRWLGQALQNTTNAIPIPPVPVKAIHVNQTINGVNQEVPFQIEDWASEYRIPLGLTDNATVFSNRQMIVFLVNVTVSKVTIWWNGSDTATQTLYAYTTTQFADDDTAHGILTNGKLSLVLAAAQYLYVDGFDATSTSWSTFGTTPYLNDNTTSYISHNINNQRMGWFTFEDLSNAQTLASAAIKSVMVEFDCKRDGSDDYFDFRVNDGTTTYGPYNITNPPSDYGWRQYDISSIATDWSKIDTLKIDVGYKQQGGGSSNVYVRRARLSIDFGGWLTSVASNTTAKADFLRVNDESPTYGAGLAYVIHHGVVRDIVQQEAEWSSGISEILYVDSFDNTTLQWTETGSSPYLSNSDSNYISTNGTNNIEGWFGFQNLSINSFAGLKIEFECRDSDPNSDDYFEFQITDGVSTYGWYEIKNLPDSYGWRSYDLPGIITSVAQLNNMKISIRYRQVGSSASTIDIRRSRVDVVTVPNVYSQIILTLPANASYYTYQLRLMFIDSLQNRTITDLSLIRLSSSINQLQTENGTINGFPVVTNGTGSFYNFSSGTWTAHHWSQFISGTQGAGIMFTDAANLQLYAFDSIVGNATGALKADTSAKTIELLPVTLTRVQFNYAIDATWHGAVATFDSTATPMWYKTQDGNPTGLWILAEYPPTITVTPES